MGNRMRKNPSAPPLKAWSQGTPSWRTRMQNSGAVPETEVSGDFDWVKFWQFLSLIVLCFLIVLASSIVYP